MDLQYPGRKMSTTGGSEQGTVYVLDDPAAIAKKFRSAVTDSGTEVRRSPDKPGVTNLVDILAVTSGRQPEEVERQFDGSGYGALKQAVADAVAEYLAPVRQRYPEFRGDEAELERVFAQGAAKARELVAPVLRDVREAMGFRGIRAGQ
jgi:tryptophanyl-tRNA synthetase